MSIALALALVLAKKADGALKPGAAQKQCRSAGSGVLTVLERAELELEPRAAQGLCR